MKAGRKGPRIRSEKLVTVAMNWGQGGGGVGDKACKVKNSKNDETVKGENS